MGSPARRIGWLAVAFLGFGCHREAVLEPVAELPAVQVGTAVARAGSNRAFEEVTGTVRSRTRAAIESKVSGRIDRMHAFPGLEVEAGDVLVELDVREIRAQLEQARTVALQAERDFERLERLFRQEAITRAEFEGVEARRGVARASVVEAEAMLGYARIAAPFRGVVTRRMADVGDLAVPGRPLLEIEDPRALRFEADVPATLSRWVRLGQELGIRLDAGSGSVTGKVSEIEPSADPLTRTFRVRLDLPPDSGARGGWFGRMALPIDESRVITVPAAAVSTRGQMELVRVVADGRARLRIVRTGKRLGNDLEVLAGLDAGETVIADARAVVRDGQRVVSQSP
ncbi:MAG: efflux RND transporter periplasmic adaptor subunit [Limisphaerales bacterium]